MPYCVAPGKFSGSQPPFMQIQLRPGLDVKQPVGADDGGGTIEAGGGTTIIGGSMPGGSHPPLWQVQPEPG